MDDRFPKYLRVLVHRLSFIAIPNLGMLIAGLAVLGFVGTVILQAPMDRFIFDPDLVRQGEYWRLFAYPLIQEPIWLLFYVMYVYFVMGTLESSWGTAPLTIFTLLSYGCAILASFAGGISVPIWVHVMENVSLAFGTLFPDLELYLFFVLPVKAKWLALLAGGILLYQFFVGDSGMKIFLAIGLAPYLIFFGPLLYKNLRTRYIVARNRRRF